MTSAPEKTAPTAAQQALAAAADATAATNAKLQPAQDGLAAAREALAAAEDEALQAIVVKNPDAKAARDRIEKSRFAIKTAQDNIQWAALELHAVEAQEQQARDAEQTARRAVTVEQIQIAAREYNDPAARENVLLGLLKDTVAELIPIIADREELHTRLTNELPYLSPEEKAHVRGSALAPGRPSHYAKPLLLIPGQPQITLDSDALTDALIAGIQAAKAAQAERDRAARHG